MAKKKVFVSFDFDNDKTLKDFIIGQAKIEDSPFEVIAFSLRGAAPEKTLLDKTRRNLACRGVHRFIVMLGLRTRFVVAPLGSLWRGGTTPERAAVVLRTAMAT